MFKINSEKELLNLLKIVAEEAVIKSKKMLNESTDIAQERYINSLNSSESLYNVKLSEQEEPEEEPVSDDIQPEEEEPEEEEPEEEVLDPEDFGVSFDSVIKDINTLRSGRSTKDKEIKGELLGYYEKLDEGERKILHQKSCEAHLMLMMLSILASLRLMQKLRLAIKKVKVKKLQVRNQKKVIHLLAPMIALKIRAHQLKLMKVKI